MHDANVLPYGSDSEQPADVEHVDPDEVDDEVMRAAGYTPLSEHAETTEPYYVVGDAPAFRRTGITDRQAAGVDRMPPWANTSPNRFGRGGDAA